jgi:uncharacterized membrane protein YedE/YeeE
MTEFSPFTALLGGALIGLASTLLLWLNGRVAGISGIFGGVVVPHKEEFGWRLAFVAGLVLGGVAMLALNPDLIVYDLQRSSLVVVLGGLLVGFGTRLGNGCTSGHGVCGLSRLSTRSFASVLTFMAVGALVVYVVRTAFGGVL